MWLLGGPTGGASLRRGWGQACGFPRITPRWERLREAESATRHWVDGAACVLSPRTVKVGLCRCSLHGPPSEPAGLTLRRTRPPPRPGAHARGLMRHCLPCLLGRGWGAPRAAHPLTHAWALIRLSHPSDAAGLCPPIPFSQLSAGTPGAMRTHQGLCLGKPPISPAPLHPTSHPGGRSCSWGAGSLRDSPLHPEHHLYSYQLLLLMCN